MEIIKPFLLQLIDKSRESNNVIYRRNLLKDYIQIIILNFIYSHPKYSQMVFYGGSCLRHCFELPRLSEDLDFVDLKKKIQLSELADDLKKYFQKNTDLEIKIKVQPSRIQIKFAILKELGLSEPSESDFLYLKLEIFKNFGFCSGFQINPIPIFKFNRSIIIKTFDLPTMMATKIGAILNRKWEKTTKDGKILARVKGRDYFDLFWYLNKPVKPNLACLMNKRDVKNLKKKLLDLVAKVDLRSIEYDLNPLISDPIFVQGFTKNIKEILKREILKKMS